LKSDQQTHTVLLEQARYRCYYTITWWRRGHKNKKIKCLF